MKSTTTLPPASAQSQPSNFASSMAMESALAKQQAASDQAIRKAEQATKELVRQQQQMASKGKGAKGAD